MVSSAIAPVHQGFVGLHAASAQEFVVLCCVNGGFFRAQQVVDGLPDESLAIDGNEYLERPVESKIASFPVLDINRQRDGLDQIFDETQLFRQLPLHPLAIGNIRADTHIPFGQAVGVEQWHDGRADPIVMTVASAVADLTAPHAPGGNGLPHLGEHLGRVLS